MEKRRDPGSMQGLTCRLDIDGRRHHAIVLNVASRVLLVHTRAKPPEDLQRLVMVRMRLPESPTLIVLQTSLTRWCPVPSRLARVAGGSMELSIRRVPDAWSEFADGERLVPVEIESPQLLENSRSPSESCSNSIDIGVLPAIGCLPRSQCRSCNREGRSLWSGLCGWCLD